MNARLRTYAIGLSHNPSPPEPTICTLAEARANLSEHDELLLLRQFLAENGYEDAAEDFLCNWLEDTNDCAY